jgi:peptidoglycan/xylan/chitin deacetylase (PgdA/CDA1 family)
MGFDKAKALIWGAQTLKMTGFSRIIGRCMGGRGVILMFHSLTRAPDNRINMGGVLAADFFAALLKELQNLDVMALRLKDVPAHLSANHNQRFVCLTFDDGYKDNAHILAPMLEQAGVPATVFVTSGALDGTLSYEWGMLEEYLRNNDHIKIGDINAPIQTLTDKRRVYRTITKHCLNDYNSWKPLLDRLFEEASIDRAALIAQQFMSAEEVKAISRMPMIDIGGHTIAHPMLSRLDEPAALHEIKRNREDLAALTGQDIDCFAYPFGGLQACAVREYALAQQAGYSVAVTTQSGVINTAHKDNLWNLPRIGVSGLYEHPAMTGFYTSGFWPLLRRVLTAPAVS